MTPWLRTVLMLLALAGAFVACSDSDPTAPDDAPEGHTILKDGAAHAPGLSDPVTNCAQCHGSDLRGGSAGEPSCHSCHGKVW